MRVGFVADVHSNLHAFEAVLRHLGANAEFQTPKWDGRPCSCGAPSLDVDRVYHVGDLVGYAAHPSEVTELAAKTTEGGVLGNHDWAALREGLVPFNPAAFAGLKFSREALTPSARSHLTSLPLHRLEKLDGFEVTIVHGSPADPLWEYVFPEEAERVLRAFEAANPGAVGHVLVLGHTHVPIARTSSTGSRSMFRAKASRHFLFNPGSVGQPRDGDPRASALVFDTETGEGVHHRVPYDISGAARAVRDADLPIELAERLFLGR